MNCSRHNNRIAVEKCITCGRDMCEDCTVVINGTSMCKECVAQMASNPNKNMNNHTNHYNNRNNPYGGAYDPRYAGMPPSGRPRRASGFLTFMFSAVPGANYMYLGLMKRGIFFMTSFFLVIAMMSFLNSGIMAIPLLIILFYSFFDGFLQRRRINAGYDVPDDIEDIMPIFRENKKLVIAILVAFVSLSVLSSLSSQVFRIFNSVFGFNDYHAAYSIITNLVGIIIIVLGVFLIYKAFFSKSGKDGKNNDDVNKFNDNNRR